MHCLFNLNLVTYEESNNFAYRPAFHFHATFVQSKLESQHQLFSIGKSNFQSIYFIFSLE